MWWILKRVCSVVFAIVCACTVGMMLYASNVCKLKAIDGKRTFYLYSASSQASMVSTLTLDKIFSVRGESVRFPLQNTGEQTAEEILSKYNARLVCTERIDGITSYYAVSESFASGIVLFGERVNLHVAVSETECVVGSPVIFGGF